MNVTQRTVFGSNNTEVHTATGIGAILAVGFAAAMISAAIVIGTLIGGAVAFAITVLAATTAGILAVRACTRSALEVAHWRATRQLPPQRPLLTINRPLPIEAPQPQMRVTRADYPDRVYPGERDRP
jgi:hypothetical protein